MDFKYLRTSFMLSRQSTVSNQFLTFDQILDHYLSLDLQIKHFNSRQVPGCHQLVRILCTSRGLEAGVQSVGEVLEVGIPREDVIQLLRATAGITVLQRSPQQERSSKSITKNCV